jgi:hypothetical protein
MARKVNGWVNWPLERSVLVKEDTHTSFERKLPKIR